MIPLTNLYDEYIGRPKLTEQKNIFEYIVPPSPIKWCRNKNREKGRSFLEHWPRSARISQYGKRVFHNEVSLKAASYDLECDREAMIAS